LSAPILIGIMIISACDTSEQDSSEIKPEEVIEVVTEEPNKITDEIPPATTIEPYIEANDFKNTSKESIVEKYGEPSLNDDNTAPAYSHFFYEAENYDLSIQFLNSKTTIDGASIYFKTPTCSHSKFSLEDMTTALSYCKLENLANNNPDKWTHIVTTLVDRYEADNIEGWRKIYVSCSDDDIISVAFYGRNQEEE